MRPRTASLVCFLRPIGAGETHSRRHRQGQSQAGAGRHEGTLAVSHRAQLFLFLLFCLRFGL